VARILALLVAVTCFLVPTGSPASAAPDHFRPRAGTTFNNPLGDTAARRAIFRKIIRSIDSSPRGSVINVFSWNYLTREGTDALLRAQKRGVRVRLLMDASNNIEIPNQPYRRLRAGLHHGNKGLKPARRSWAKTCDHSCRGGGGAAHAKFYMFSQVGNVPRVVMQGSANLTLASTNNQWNDINTHVRSKPVWNFYDRIFTQAQADRRVRSPFQSQSFGDFDLIEFPLARAKDPVMSLLDKVSCRRASNTASHRTVIRIAPDVIRQDRGMRLARKVRSLWNHGCDIRIGYTVVGVDVGRLLRSSAGRGPVPMKHLVQDYNGDGEFDNYFHLKAMSIVGNVAGKRGNYVVLNGSANWSDLSAGSDENLGVYWQKDRTLVYQKDLNYWWTHFPSTSGYGSSADRRTTRVPTPDRLVFGAGRRAVFEDGTPYSRSGVDPYAHLARD
jgi:phosphatidylserine/phosphatidylglycerophosphate/cardiolipin synthase-like enzyme